MTACRPPFSPASSPSRHPAGAGADGCAGLGDQTVEKSWDQGGGTATALGPAMTFSSDGRVAHIGLGGQAGRDFAHYPVGGNRTTAADGLPQSGYPGVVGNTPFVASLFIDTDTQFAPTAPPSTRPM